MARLPFNQMVGIGVDRIHKDGVTVSCPFRHDLKNIHGTLHGGVTATLADVAGGFSSMARYGIHQKMTTVDIKINYLAPITGKRAVARGRIIRAGKTLCVIQVEVRGDRGPVAAVAIVTYMMLQDR